MPTCDACSHDCSSGASSKDIRDLTNELHALREELAKSNNSAARSKYSSEDDMDDLADFLFGEDGADELGPRL